MTHHPSPPTSSADTRTFTAFVGTHCLSSGGLSTVLLKCRAYLQSGALEPLLIFDEETGRQRDFDFRGTDEEILAKAQTSLSGEGGEPKSGSRAGPGRPRLGVVPREVTLLPRHWDWLEQQPSGVSATLRKLVEEASRRGSGQELARRHRDATSRMLWSLAGNLPHFEEVSRALFAHDQARLEQLIASWPEDLRGLVTRRMLEAQALGSQEAAPEPHS